MARTSTITFGQVAQIADAMKAAGNRPTARAVRERIGSGSMGTIHKLLQQWQGKASEADEETEAAELPMHIQNALMDFIGTEIATACEPINEELQAAKEAAEELATENERLARLIETLEKDSYNAEMARSSEKARADALHRELAEAKAHLAEANARNTEYLRDLDRSQRQTEMFASYGPDLEKARTALASSESARIEAERNAAVLTAQLTAKTEMANELGERLKAAESLASSKDTELKQANNFYQACAARLEAAAREIESLKGNKAKAKPTPVAKKPAAVKKTDGNF